MSKIPDTNQIPDVHASEDVWVFWMCFWIIWSQKGRLAGELDVGGAQQKGKKA